MIDLFGLGRTQEKPETDGSPSPYPAPEESRGSHRLWAFLLVLDSIFVVVFGGAVATIVYKHWQEPAVIAAPARRVPARMPAAAKPAASAPAPAAEVPKPAPRAPAKTARAEGPRPPKPSLFEPPRPRGTPALASTSAASASAPAAPSVPGKAQPVVFKLHAPHAASVQLVGAFIVHGGRKEMTKAREGVWTVKLYLNPGKYRYFFAVDRRKTLDPENPNSDRGASLLTVP